MYAPPGLSPLVLICAAWFAWAGIATVDAQTMDPAGATAESAVDMATESADESTASDAAKAAPTRLPVSDVESTTAAAADARSRPAFPLAGRKAVVVPVRGAIDNVTRDSILRRFDEARANDADTIILVLDTPGGLVTAALDITRYLRSQTDLKVISFVERQAYSAGTMIGLATDLLVMQRGSAMGDSAPIAMAPGGGLQPMGDTERAKAESPIQADFYTSAVRNNYDPLLVGSLVTVGRVVHFVASPDGERKFVEPEQYASLIQQGWKPVAGVPDPVDRGDTLLTVDDALAAKIGLSAGSFDSVEQFARESGITLIRTLEPTLTERFTGLLGSAAVRLILMAVFIQSLYIAMHAPGHGVPEAVAMTAFGLLVGTPLLSGYAQWYEILAIFLGMGLIAVELFLIPGFGVAGIAGLVLMLGGLLMTFVGIEPGRAPFSLPQLGVTWDALQQGLLVVLGGLTASLLLSIWVRRYLPSLPYFNRLILNTTAGEGGAGVLVSDDGQKPFPTIGSTGTAATDLMPGGSARFMDTEAAIERTISVVSDSGYTPRGSTVEVLTVRGGYVVVRKTPGASV